ncbi:MAG: pyrroloquinoline quinone precursor peptide PqqA, partial [Planctomycetota bacterium]
SRWVLPVCCGVCRQKGSFLCCAAVLYWKEFKTQQAPLGGHHMAWTTPKVVEIAVGLEINSYVCAEL